MTIFEPCGVIERIDQQATEVVPNPNNDLAVPVHGESTA